MYVALAVCFTAATVHGGPVSDSLGEEALHAKWSSFKSEHGKGYASHEEDAKKQVFFENTRVIEEHNERFRQGLESFELAHNHMSDLTAEEIQQTHSGLIMPEDVDEVNQNATVHMVSEGYKYPEKFDWRDFGAVTPVKDPVNCGTCSYSRLQVIF